MSDGGRGRVSLAVEMWKSSQEWRAQRSAVRSIAWLDGSGAQNASHQALTPTRRLAATMSGIQGSSYETYFRNGRKWRHPNLEMTRVGIIEDSSTTANDRGSSDQPHPPGIAYYLFWRDHGGRAATGSERSPKCAVCMAVIAGRASSVPREWPKQRVPDSRTATIEWASTQSEATGSLTSDHIV